MTQSERTTVIHTVLLTPSKERGLAIGRNAAGQTIRVFLATPRAVGLAMDKLEAFARQVRNSSEPQTVKRPSKWQQAAFGCQMREEAVTWTLS